MNGKQNAIIRQRVSKITDETLKTWETTALTFGVLSIVLCFVLGIGFGIAGIVYAKRCEKQGVESATVKWGKTLSIIGLVWSLLVSAVLLVCLFPFISVLGGMLLYLLTRITFG